jgi:hypothetical protein
MHILGAVMQIGDAARFRRLVGGVALIVAPLAFLAGTLIHPGLDPSATDQLQLIEDHPDRWYATHILGLVFITLAIPAVFALLSLLRVRGVVWGHLGAALSMVGLVSWTGVVTIYGFVAWQLAEANDRSRMAELFDDLNHTAAVAMPFRIGPMAFAFGMICLAVGLYRAKAARALPALAIGMAPVLFAVGALRSFLPMMIIGSLQMTLGLGSVGWGMLRSSAGAPSAMSPARG